MRQISYVKLMQLIRIGSIFEFSGLCYHKLLKGFFLDLSRETIRISNNSQPVMVL
jgi:hypothetical protein